MNYERSPSLLGGILKGLAGAVIIFGVLAGIIAGSERYGFQWGVFFLYVGISLTAGLFLASFAEIIFLLQTSCDKQHEILMYLKGKTPVSDNNTETSVEQKENAQDLTAGSTVVNDAPKQNENAEPAEPPQPKAAAPAYDPTKTAPEVVIIEKPTEDEIICPHCGCHQQKDRKLCWKCGAVFQYAGETAEQAEDSTSTTEI